MKTRHEKNGAAANRPRALPLLAAGLAVVGLAACGSGSNDDEPSATTTTPTGNPADDVPGTGDGADPMAPDTGETDGLPTDMMLEPEGSTLAATPRALYEFLAQEESDPRNFDVWRCAGTDGQTSDYHFGETDAFDSGAATATGSTGTFFMDTTGERTRSLTYDAVANDTIALEFRAVIDPGASMDVYDVLYEFETIEEARAYIEANGLEAEFGSYRTIEELRAYIDTVPNAPDDENEEETVDTFTVQERDEITTVRTGPDRRWSGYSMLRDATLSCEEVRSEGRLR